MAYGVNVGADVSGVAGEDLSAAQFRFVVEASDGRIYRVDHATAGTVIGVLQNDPTEGQTASVRPSGLSPIVAGETFSPGAVLLSDVEGRARAAQPLELAGLGLGVALESAGSVGAVATMRLRG